VKSYRFEKEEALRVEEFLKPMLDYDINKRISAKEALNAEWLNNH
jgi:hypothetical protein